MRSQERLASLPASATRNRRAAPRRKRLATSIKVPPVSSTIAPPAQKNTEKEI